MENLKTFALGMLTLVVFMSASVGVTELISVKDSTPKYQKVIFINHSSMSENGNQYAMDSVLENYLKKGYVIKSMSGDSKSSIIYLIKY